MQHQGLDISILRSLCKVCRGIFPSEDALRALSRPSLLRTVHTTLGCIVRNLDILNQQLSKTKDAQNLEAAKWNVLGLQNNIHCMAWLLNSSLETPEPTPADTGTQPSWLPDPSQGTWAAKVAGLKFLYGYHSFMQAAGTVFREWGDSLSRSRRHSPRRHSSQRGRQHKGSRRTVSPRRVRGPGPQSWLPR
ncbi:oncostatin-M [Perognathus longimembris pacificus]|uniref:oncostatin-M n=1 Tax=Perognathus longimembris pacificus TaxID=214514 RepID=UPI002018B7C5|nr:oncostatin-M [Perognathus longimembris pacificus]